MDIPRIYEPLDLGEYAEGLAGQTIYVWVNPPRRLMQEYIDLSMSFLYKPSLIGRVASLLRSDNTEQPLVRWLAKVWSLNGFDPSSGDEVVAFATGIVDEDPALWDFLVRSTFKMIGQHRDEAKKGLTRLFAT